MRQTGHRWKWIPTSTNILKQSECEVLKYLKLDWRGKFISLKNHKPNRNNHDTQSKTLVKQNQLWTLMFNENSTRTPIVLIHGLCAAAGLWVNNIEALAHNRPVYAIDLLGFGRSSRPKFSSEAKEAEEQHVESIESWRSAMKLDKFILIGHSMGGFISSSYAMKYPDRVAHLVVVDPWGYPKKPHNFKEIILDDKSILYKFGCKMGMFINPLGVVRFAGPFGHWLISLIMSGFLLKFETLKPDLVEDISRYIYHCNLRKPTGESSFRAMMDFYIWAKNPICDRLVFLRSPLTIIYGERKGLPKLEDCLLRKIRSGHQETNAFVIGNAGHNVHLDNHYEFTQIVNLAAESVDCRLQNLA